VNAGVHQTHCCLRHGCKYGDEDCPVESNHVHQTYPCEECLSVEASVAAYKEAFADLRWATLLDLRRQTREALDTLQ
jgi:hypothetical protein